MIDWLHAASESPAALTWAAAMPPDVSAEGWRIDTIVATSAWLLAVAAAVGTLYLLFVVFTRRDREGAAPASLLPEKRQRLAPLLAAALVLFGIDGFLLYRSLTDVEAVVGAAEPEGAVRVEVNGHQWAWEFRYAGGDGRFATLDDVVTTGRLVVPVDTAVAVQLASSDVVHSLHIPALRVKRDAVPGHIARFSFVATEAGRYEVACAEFCGASHHRMSAELVVLPADEYWRWLAREQADALRMRKELERAAADPELGEVSPAAAEAGRDWGWGWQ